MVHRSPVAGRSMSLNGLIYFVDVVLWLLRNRNRYDVIHCQQMFGPAMAACAASVLIRKPVVVRVTLSGATGEAAAVKRMSLSGLRNGCSQRSLGG